MMVRMIAAKMKKMPLLMVTMLTMVIMIMKKKKLNIQIMDEGDRDDDDDDDEEEDDDDCRCLPLVCYADLLKGSQVLWATTVDDCALCLPARGDASACIPSSVSSLVFDSVCG